MTITPDDREFIDQGKTLLNQEWHGSYEEEQTKMYLGLILTKYEELANTRVAPQEKREAKLGDVWVNPNTGHKVTVENVHTIYKHDGPLVKFAFSDGRTSVCLMRSFVEGYRLLSGVAPQEPSEAKHTRHVTVTECFPLACLEGDCDHRDEDGEPEDMSVCPPTPMEVCVDCMVEDEHGEDPYHWDDVPLALWPCVRPLAARAPAAQASPIVDLKSDWHYGRSFRGTRVENECPCEQQGCGLVTGAAARNADCSEHKFDAGKTIRQSHRAESCPALAAPVAVDKAKLADDES